MDIAKYWKTIVDTLQDGSDRGRPHEEKLWRPILPQSG